MGKQDAILVFLTECLIFSLIISSNDWFFLKIIVVTQLITLLILIAYYQTEQTKKHILRSKKGLAAFIIPMLLFSLTGSYYARPWVLTSDWETSAELFSGPFGEI